MKKLLVIFMIMAMLLVAFTSCDKLPDGIKDAIDSVFGGDETPDETPGGDETPDETPGGDETPDETPGGDETPDETPHTHDFKAVSTKNPTCTEAGLVKYECSCGEKKEENTAALGHDFQVTEEKQANCSKDGYVKSACANCGETQEEVIPATGHNFQVTSKTAATCNKDGVTKYKCKNCGYKKEEKSPKTGHNFEDFVEQSRLMRCTNDFCSYAKFADGNGKYKEVLVYSFSEEDLAEFDTIFNELDAIIKAAAPYDKTLHAYEEGSDTEAAYLVMEAKYEELYAILEYVTAQYQLAEIEYRVSMSAAKEENYNYISDLRTELVADFYSFSGPIADSMFREYYYYGMTDEEILAFVLESDSVANEEYMALTKRNTEIELEFMEIRANADTSELIPDLYAEFVSNNNRIAQILGYDNYLEYAYENVYDRDYAPSDVAEIREYVKQYITPVFKKAYSRWDELVANVDFNGNSYLNYETYINESFFSNYVSNHMLNDYIDLLNFTSNPDKQITFSDAFNGLLGDGNLFRGNYQGAFVTSIYGLDIPVAYFGGGSYSSAFTVVHEFGHYMNEVYGGGKFSQSYDLLEMHSQGNELLFLAYLQSRLPEGSCDLVETYQLVNMLYTVMAALAVDTFEQAVYLDYYDGPAAATIMADGTITADEYDALYADIVKDLGAPEYLDSTYWRSVTIGSPCYYVSYSISALSVLQLYSTATLDFDTAKDSYLKLFSYVDTYKSEEEYEYMTTEETLIYAGMYGFTDEEMYKLIYSSLNNVLS